jgi:hypothetical protein
MRKPPVRHSQWCMTLLATCGLTIMAWAGVAGTGQPPGEPPPPAPALAHLTCKAFRASQQVEIQGTLAATQHGTYTAAAQLTTPTGRPVFPEPIPLGTLVWPKSSRSASASRLPSTPPAPAAGP